MLHNIANMIDRVAMATAKSAIAPVKAKMAVSHSG